MNASTKIASVIAFCVLFASCASIPEPYPPRGTDRLVHLSPHTEKHFTSPRLTDAVTEIESARRHRLYSVLVSQYNELLYERYFNGRDASSPHDIRSATKSVTAILTGIAVEQGVVPRPNESVATALQQYYHARHGNDVSVPDELLLGHLLTMSSGKTCNDHQRSSPGNEKRMYRREDWTRFFLELDQQRPPGEVAEYCTGGVVALGSIISTGLGSDDFARWADESLFAPLGITNYEWARYDDGRSVDTGGHLLITPRGLLQIGLLLLNDGRWNGDSLVSAEWIEAMWRPRVNVSGANYGYLWWITTADYGTGPLQVYTARGNGGQSLFVVPDLGLAAVVTTGYYNRARARIADQLFFLAILPDVLEIPRTGL